MTYLPRLGGAGLLLLLVTFRAGTQEPLPLPFPQAPQALPQQGIPQPGDPQQGIEEQARGPIHEAFAQPNDEQRGPGLAAPKDPPAPIPELPPEERPEGDNVEWIGGYWAWDADRNDFVWVSGVYRNVPEGRRYVPGYWTQTGEGWRWVPGFWAAEGQQELQYVPEPPASLENGPSVPGPEDATYVSGYWVYRDSGYAWRPGYWSAAQQGAIWTSPRYLWTPNGYVFVNGYWDYPYDDRGLLFAPVVFNQPYWNTPGWFYRPRYVVGSGAFLNFGFYRPGSFHFWFGDYFGPRYAGLGYRPWFNGRGAYDPLWSYYRWQNRGTPGFGQNLALAYANRDAGRLPVPPRTLAGQNAFLAQNKGFGQKGPGQNFQMLTSLNNQANQQNLRLTKFAPNQLDAVKNNVQQTRNLALERRSFESKGKGLGNGSPFANNNPNQPNNPIVGGQNNGLHKTFKLPPNDNRPLTSNNIGNNPNVGNNKGPANKGFDSSRPIFNGKNNDVPKGPNQPFTQQGNNLPGITLPKNNDGPKFPNKGDNPRPAITNNGFNQPQVTQPKLNLPTTNNFNPANVNPGVVNPGVVNPGVVNPGVGNPGVGKPSVVNPGNVKPNIVNPGNGNTPFSLPKKVEAPTFNPRPVIESRPSFSNPNISNPNVSKPVTSNPVFTNPVQSQPKIINNPAPQIFNKPATSQQPRIINNPSPAPSLPKFSNPVKQSFYPPSNPQPRSFSPPASSAPRSFSPPSISAPRSFTPPRSVSPPSGGGRPGGGGGRPGRGK